MKKIFLLAVGFLFAFVAAAQQQHPENCPFGGVTDCTGQCGLFVDENGDGICDNAVLSKPAKQAKQEDKPQPQQTVTTKQNTENANQSTVQAKKQDVYTEKTAIDLPEPNETVTQATQTVTQTEQTATQETAEPKPQREFPYHFWQVLIATLALYFCSAALVKAKKIKKVNHRRVWNVVLALTCLVSCLIGLYVVLAKMYGWNMNYMTLMQLHVDFGVSMTVVAIIHALWHMNYWKNLFKSAGGKA
ncbi:MAG: hypothetical protein J6M30_03020 [Bacteroidales bacterium]|nr:hypothetical protein [Bacteroidales bacterium]